MVFIMLPKNDRALRWNKRLSELRTRRHHERGNEEASRRSLKANVALDAIEEARTLAQLTGDYGVHANQLNQLLFLS